MDERQEQRMVTIETDAEASRIQHVVRIVAGHSPRIRTTGGSLACTFDVAEDVVEDVVGALRGGAHRVLVDGVDHSNPGRPRLVSTVMGALASMRQAVGEPPLAEAESEAHAKAFIEALYAADWSLRYVSKYPD